mgnify:CR=1 FL=1
MESDEAISITNSILSLTSIVLAAVGLVMVMFFGLLAFTGFSAINLARSYRKKLQELEDRDALRVVELGKMDRLASVSLHNLIISADFALAQLPEITFTQQLPLQLLRKIRALDRALSNAGVEMWARLPATENGARIQYAIALYHFGQAAHSADLVRTPVGPGDERIEAILTLVLSACRGQRSLERSVRLRLSQVHRQLGDFDSAARVLSDGLEGTDPQTESMARWGLAVLYLQQGLTLPALDDRRSAFWVAWSHARDLFASAFGWASSYDPPLFDIRLRSANVAYYAAKSIWAWRCTFPRSECPSPETVAEMRRASEMALLLFDRVRREFPEDPFISAIYDFCVAYILVAIKSIPECEYPPRDLGLKHLDSNSECDTYCFECLARAERAVRDLKRFPDAEGGVTCIYVESSERLDTLDAFLADIRFVRRAHSSPEVLFQFFGGSGVVY